MTDLDDRFCPLCDVAVDLHDPDGSCQTAIERAEAVEAFWGIPLDQP